MTKAVRARSARSLTLTLLAVVVASSAVAAATARAADGVPANSVPPQINGDASSVGNTVGVTDGTWSSSPTSFGYEWWSCQGTTDTCSPLASATSSSYTIASSDLGNSLYAVVTATNGAGSTSVTSEFRTVVVGSPQVVDHPVLSGSQHITLESGSVVPLAEVGNQLSVTSGTWTNSPTISYQWIRCDSGYSNCNPISGETSASYTIAAADLGFTVGIRGDAANSYGTYQDVGFVRGNVGAPNPLSDDGSISGTAQVGQTLTAVNASSWAGVTPITFSYTWQRCDSAGNACTEISGATNQTYTAIDEDQGRILQVLIKGTNQYNQSGGNGYGLAYASGVVSAAQSSGGGSSSGPTDSGSTAPPAPTSVSAPDTAQLAAGTAVSGSVTITPTTGASSAPITVSWAAGAFDQNVQVTLSTVDALAKARGVSALTPLGGIAVASSTQLVVLSVRTSSDGQDVTSFAKPVDLSFPGAPAGYIPSYSHDGTAWLAIPALAAPPLPDGQADGYYRDNTGTLHVLTRHATYFALYAPGSFGDPTLNRAGAPNITLIGRPRLTHGGRRIVARVEVDEQATVAISVFDAHGNLRDIMRAESRIGIALFGGKVRALARELDWPGSQPVVVNLARGRLRHGNFRIRIIAVDPGGKRTVSFFRG